MVSSGEREGGRNNIGVRGKKGYYGLYDIVSVKLLRTQNTIEFKN